MNTLRNFFGAALLALALALAPSSRAAFPTIGLQPISLNQLQSPTYLCNAGDGSGRLFVCEQRGKILIVQNGALLATPFLDLGAELVPTPAGYDERGLLGMAFHPDYANAAKPGYRHFYVFYSAPSPNAVGTSSISAIATGNPCTITTTAAHGLKTGDLVTITGVTGGTFNPAINATYAVTFVDTTHFTVPVDCSDTTGLSVTSGRVRPVNPVNCRSTISEFLVSAADPNVADPASERILLAFDKPQSNHDGGQLDFGPDGYLYFSVGDGGSQHDNDAGHTGGSTSRPTGNLGNGQDKTKLLAKIHRIDPLGLNGPGGHYGIPADNPFVGAGGGVREEIWAYGMRNPWRFSFDPPTGRMFCGDVGQDSIEEVDLIVKGGNYGWHAKEGTRTEDATLLNALLNGGSALVDPPPSATTMLPGGATLIDPIAQYAHTGTIFGSPALPQIGNSVTGGYVYRGSAFPELTGKYVFADWGLIIPTPSGTLLGLEETSPGVWGFSILAVLGGNPIPTHIAAFGRDEQGEIYLATKTNTNVVANDPNTGLPAGGIYKIVPVRRFTTTVQSAKDNTIFAEDLVLGRDYSDALGYLYAGKTGTMAGPYVRRALVAFDVAGKVPAGAVVQSAQLKLNLAMAGANAAGTSMTLHRLSEPWGEGTSQNTMGGGGAPATPGDATWTYNQYNTSTWSTPGGTYDATASATAVIGSPGLVTWASTAGLVANVQSWLTTPADNNGWILLGEEGTDTTACQFDSLQSGTTPPALEITYDAYTYPIVLNVPADITAEATGASGAVVSFNVTATDKNSTPLTPVATPTSGSTFPLGTTTVNITVSDGAGTTTTGSFTVTVHDTTKPVLTVPGAIDAEATSASGAVVTFNPTAMDAVSTPNVVALPASGSTFPFGTTTVNVSATDAAGNVATGSFDVTVADTTAPMITAPVDGFTPLIVTEGTVPDYHLQPVVTDATAVVVTQDPPAGSISHVGTTHITLTATDAANNEATIGFDVAVRPTGPPSTPAIAQGADAPGAGGLSGLPADAKLGSFGVPATDNDGDLTYLAKWASPTAGKGSGLFKNADCLAIIGGDAVDLTGVAGTKFKTLSDPVVDAGSIACLATFSGLPATKAAAVLSDVDGSLAVIAQAGSPALDEGGLPLEGGATFKSFKAVAVSGSSVAFLAQLTGGTGTGRTNATNDYGVWVKSGVDDPVLVLREGQAVGNTKIKTLISFAAGNGSPGQGRGWLLAPGGTANVLALVLLADRTQAIVRAQPGVAGFSVQIQSGAISADGAPDLAGASFQSFHLPAVNALDQIAFLASLTPGLADVTRATAPGIFLNEWPNLSPLIARVGSSPAGSSVTFSQLKDPVLAADGGLAFPATLKHSASVKGLAAATLWWQPPGGTLQLLAQGGAEPPGLPGAQWKSFTSLAIAANRGPIFAATLVLNKGGVTRATASGVWAMDFESHLRRLFQTGVTQIDLGGTTGMQTVKSFTLLNAIRGSNGVTRSFNDAQQVVWLATFMDRSQAIVVTDVP